MPMSLALGWVYSLGEAQAALTDHDSSHTVSVIAGSRLARASTPRWRGGE
jgi:hypothetical protein